MRRAAWMDGGAGGSTVTDALGTRAAARCAKALEVFQSRGVRNIDHIPLERELPGTVYALGEPEAVWYFSDKDDPETRDKRRRFGLQEDPDGVQGVWKRFRHGHDLGWGLRLYAGADNLRGFDRRWMPDDVDDSSAALDVAWPEAVWWLAFLEKVEWKASGGRTLTFKPPAESWGLWGFPDTSDKTGGSLVAWPMDRRARAKRFLLWNGGNLHVTKWGIQG